MGCAGSLGLVGTGDEYEDVIRLAVSVTVELREIDQVINQLAGLLYGVMGPLVIAQFVILAIVGISVGQCNDGTDGELEIGNALELVPEVVQRAAHRSAVGVAFLRNHVDEIVPGVLELEVVELGEYDDAFLDVGAGLGGGLETVRLAEAVRFSAPLRHVSRQHPVRDVAGRRRCRGSPVVWRDAHVRDTFGSGEVV